MSSGSPMSSVEWKVNLITRNKILDGKYAFVINNVSGEN